MTVEMIARTLVVDTSVWLNLLATEEIDRILAVVCQRYLAPERVVHEVKRNPITKQSYTDRNHPLRRGPPIEVVTLNENEFSLFTELVGAVAADRLGDGEAAAISVAVHQRAALAIDENKARRILREKFPDVILFRSVDILNMKILVEIFGNKLAKECFDKACQFGRMHFPRKNDQKIKVTKA